MNPFKSIAKRVIRSLGYELLRTPDGRKARCGVEHESVRPEATYSPWNMDCDFVDILAEIHDHTLVDKYRCFELWALVQQVAKLAAGSIIEVGVWRGGTGALLAKRAMLCGIAERVFLCDTFSGVVKAGPMDSVYRGGEHSDTDRATVEKLLFDRLGLNNVDILEGVFPDQTGDRIADRKYRLCHIDVDVYQSAREIVEWVWPRMVSGGIMVYDDYGFHGCDGVTKLVGEQARMSDRVLVHNLNGHAIVVKR